MSRRTRVDWWMITVVLAAIAVVAGIVWWSAADTLDQYRCEDAGGFVAPRYRPRLGGANGWWSCVGARR